MSRDGFSPPLSFSGHETPYFIFSDQSPQGNKQSIEEKLSSKLSTCQNAVSTSEKMLGLVFPVLTLKSYDGILEHYKEAQAPNHLVKLKQGKIQQEHEDIDLACVLNNYKTMFRMWQNVPTILKKCLKRKILLKCFTLIPYFSFTFMLLKISAVGTTILPSPVSQQFHNLFEPV